MFDNFFDILYKFSNLGLEVITSLADFGRNFFLTSINDWLGVPFGQFGNATAFEFFLISGLTFWFSYKLVKWIIF